jgi:hypothetical protein
VNQRAPINCDLLLASQLLSLPYALLLAHVGQNQSFSGISSICASGGRHFMW